MAKDTVETKAVDNKQQTQNEDSEPTYIAEIKQKYDRTGSGGEIVLCRVLVRETGRSMVRSIYGNVRVGDLVVLRECVRESRKSR